MGLLEHEASLDDWLGDGGLTRGLEARAREVAEIARAHAKEVDLNATFPHAAIAAAKRANLFALFVPIEFGGEDATISDVAEVCYILGQACASTAMIFAMHSTALACIARHCDGSPWHAMLLRRISDENLLLASSTTEGNAGGNVRASSAAVVHRDGRISLERAATVMSYGVQADGIVTTARRDLDSAAADQSLVVFMKDDYRLVPTGSWQTLGMRGTCSGGFALKAEASREQVLPARYDKIHSQSMVPVSHLAWSGVWLGIAAAAVSRAQTFVRTAVRRAEGNMPPGASQFTKAAASLQGLRRSLSSALASFEAMAEDPSRLGLLESQLAFNLLKVEMSDGALETVSLAMRACGLSGYRTDGEFAIERHLRDVLSAPIMVHNDRILANVASMSLMGPISSSLKAL